MEMTIDGARNMLMIIENSTESLKTAIEIMRKYQKIEEIIADWKSDGGVFEMSESYWLQLISEVVEGGSN
jgi:3-dehydroquinate dehydratase